MTSEAVLWTSGIMAFLHHLAAFTLTGAILYEHITFRKDLSLAERVEFKSWISSMGSPPGCL